MEILSTEISNSIENFLILRESDDRARTTTSSGPRELGKFLRSVLIVAAASANSQFKIFSSSSLQRPDSQSNGCPQLAPLPAICFSFNFRILFPASFVVLRCSWSGNPAMKNVEQMRVSYSQERSRRHRGPDSPPP